VRIAISAWFIDRPTTGSGQYLTHLLAEFAQHYQEHQFLLCGHMHHPDSALVDALGSASGDLSRDRPVNITWLRLRTPFDGRARNLAKLWFEQVAFPTACRRWQADVAHVPYWAPPHWIPQPTVVTIHDLIPALLPAYRGSLLARWYTRLVSATARRARLVLTDSEASRADIVRCLSIPAERVIAVYLAADTRYTPVTDETHIAQVRAKYALPTRYLLYLGGFDVRKNVPGILDAYAKLDLPDVPLVIAGQLPTHDSAMFPDPRRVAHELGIAAHVRFTGWVDEADKPAMYSAAVAFLFPSHYEGFGLPPLEAMACGTPVIVSNCSSLPEIAGGGGLSVEPDDADALSRAMRKLCCDAELRSRLAFGALAQVQRFRWETTARQTMEAYVATASRSEKKEASP